MTHLGLPETIATCLFDLDGVITKTAAVHEAAWRETFDTFLRRRHGAGFRPFDAHEHNAYVDGRPRAEGVRSFLASRSIVLPEGLPGDSAQQDTIHGLGRRKNELLLEKIHSEGVEPYPTTLRYIDEVRRLGLRTAVVSSSANCREVLRSIGAEDLFDVRVDGLVTAERGLLGNHTLGSTASASAVFEDALAGIDAARAGRFGFTIGVDRVGQGDALRAHGADVVVRDISELVGWE
ncbi:HAD family hydrolase [Streptomyces sp. NPDC086077]|uniref:HAD family hydrolase n=1 Tax=Streptomyces sp. NPDC086077 TaxID=3154862 RepID=UPI00344348CF